MDDELTNTLEEEFPELMKELSTCKTQDEMDVVHKKYVLKYMNELNILLGKEEITELDLTDSNLQSDKTAPIALKPETYDFLINAEGNAIEFEMKKIINGLARLKHMVYDSAADVAWQILFSGCVAIGGLAISEAFRALVTGALESAAAALGVSVATVGIVCGIAAVVIVATIIPLIYYITKPAVGILLLINEIDEKITSWESYNVHGRQVLLTDPIPGGITFKDKHYFAGGLIISRKMENALIGTQYAVTFRHYNTDFQFGFSVPLTGLYGGNSCYCSIGGTAKEAAIHADDGNLHYIHDAYGYRAEIKCNSASGSIAYYVGRIAKSKWSKGGKKTARIAK